MRYNIFKIILLILTSFAIMHTVYVYAFDHEVSPNKILIGKDHKKDGDIYLYKFSIVNVKKNIKRATHGIDIDNFFNKYSEEYTADYNCLDKTIHIFKVTTKVDNTIKDNELKIDEKVVKGTINGKLLDTVCAYKNKF